MMKENIRIDKLINLRPTFLSLAIVGLAQNKEIITSRQVEEQ